MNADPELLDTLRALSRYLRENPLACDTTEGIARWWLKESERVNVTTVEQVLALMNDLLVVEILHAADGHVRYRRRALSPDVDGKLDRLIRGELPPRALIPRGETH